MRFLFVLFSLALLLHSLGLTLGQEQSLIVQVLDLEGNPRAGIELTLTNGTFSRLFTTTGRGTAEFRLLSPGTYNVTANMEGVTVARATITYPAQTRVNLTLMIQNVELTVFDLDGDPSAGVNIELRGERGGVVRRGLTDSSGKFMVRDLPLSDFTDVGSYMVSGRLGQAVVLNTTMRVMPGISRYNFTADVVKLGVTILDFQGRPVNASLRLSSDSLNFSITLEAGRTSNLPSSSVAGQYLLQVQRRYVQGRPETTLMQEPVKLDRSLNLTYVLDISDLAVLVRDDAGSAVAGVRLLLESERLGAVGSVVTGADGGALFPAIPFSEGRPGGGGYRLSAYKDGMLVGALDFRYLPEVERVAFTLSRVETVFLILSPEDKPLSNATLRLVDTITRRVYEAVSDAYGRASVKLLPGVHSYEVAYLDVIVASGRINVTSTQISLPVEKVDIELRISVLDWSGNMIRDAEVRVFWRDRRLDVVRMENGVYLTRLPVQDEVRIDIYLGGSLAERRLVWVASPTLYEARLRGLLLGGRLVNVETIIIFAALALLAVSALSIIMRFKRTSRPKTTISA